MSIDLGLCCYNSSNDIIAFVVIFTFVWLVSACHMLVCVTNLSGESMTLEAEVSDTIDWLKAKIKDEAGIPTDQQRLIFQDKQLEGWLKTLSDFDIHDDCTLSLLVTKVFKLHVRKYGSSDCIGLDVDASHKISDIKAEIKNMGDIPTDQQHVCATDWHFRLGVPSVPQLKDEDILADHNINSENNEIVICIGHH